MLKFKMIVYYILLYITVNLHTYGQVNFEGFGIKTAAISTLTENLYLDNPIAFYPEINFRGLFFSENLHWVILFGYSDDGVKKEFRDIVVNHAYSNSSSILGARLKLHPKIILANKVLPLRFNLGISLQFNKSKSLNDYKTFSNNSVIYNTIFNIDTGFDIPFSLSQKLEIFFQTIFMFPINNHDVFDYGFRYQFGMGLFYKI